jgi:hypothetical protein
MSELSVLAIGLLLLFIAFLVQYSYFKSKNEKLEGYVATLKLTNDTLHDSLKKVAWKFYKDSIEIIVEGLTTKNRDRSLKNIESIQKFLEKNSLQVVQSNTKKMFEERYQELLAEEAKEADQDRIKEVMRDEAKAERERATETARLAKEHRDLQRRLADEQQEKHSERQAEIIAELRRLLTENEGKTARIKSMAELTKFGRIYVISNIGSFGDNFFKVGMTRRIFYEERIEELGDASVPFPFDVHMVVETEDAPALEKAIHNDLHQHRVNLVNPRKEFFSVTLEHIEEIVNRHKTSLACNVLIHIPQPSAQQFRETLKLRGQPLTFSTLATQSTGASNDSDVLFYTYENSEIQGPYTIQQIHELIEKGSTTEETLICKEGGTDWVPITAFKSTQTTPT